MTVNEKIKRLLNTRKKRVVAAVALVFVLFAVALLLYIILQSERKIKETKKDVAGKKNPEGVSTSNSHNGESGIRSDQTNNPRSLRSKPDKQVACEEALATLGRSMKAKADQATLEGLLEQVEELCPEDKFHTARMSIRNSNISTQEGIRATLNDVLERPTLNTAELESHFQKLKKLTPDEPSPSLSEYAANLYEDIKNKEAKCTVKKSAKKLKRLLRTVKSLKPYYVDAPPLKEIIDAADNDDVNPTIDNVAHAVKNNDFEPTADDVAGAAKENDVKPTADTVADAEAQEIIGSDTPNLVSPQQDRRSNLTRKMQKAMDERNKYLKELCELGISLPEELRHEFNKWKLSDFKTAHSPEFLAFMEKARNSNDEVLMKTIRACHIYQFKQANFILESHKHRIDRDDAFYNHENHSSLARFVVYLKRSRIPISNVMLEWLKGEDWEQIKRYVEQELFCLASSEAFILPWFYEAADSEYYKATLVLLWVHRFRKSLDKCKITHSPNLQDYWTAVEKAWRGGTREYEKLKYQEFKKLCEFEELENKFKGTNVHAFRDEFANIYRAVHVKLNALEFLKEFESTESELVKNKAIELGIDPENIKENHLSKFEGCPKVYNLLIIKLFANKVKEASFDQIAKLLNEHNDEYKKITLELISFKECDKFAAKIREGLCSISSEGKITCSTPRWNERVNDPKWLGYILFKPTKPYQPSYLRNLLSREQELRQRYDHLKLIHMFINDLKPDSSVHPGRPTKHMHFSTRIVDSDSPNFKYANLDGGSGGRVFL